MQFIRPPYRTSSAVQLQLWATIMMKTYTSTRMITLNANRKRLERTYVAHQTVHRIVL